MTELVIEAESRVQLADRELPDPLATPPWEDVAGLRLAAMDDPSLDASRFAFASPFVELDDSARALCAAELHAGPADPRCRASSSTGASSRTSPSTPTATTLATPVAEVFARRRGVCQDFSHLMLACLRSLGLPARYQSGYIMTHPPEGQDQARRCRCQPRLGGALRAAQRLGGARSHQ